MEASRSTLRARISAVRLECGVDGTGAVMGLDAIYDEMAQTREGDKLPLCRYTKSEPVKIGMGTTRIPQFEIVEWVERPIALSSVDDAQSAAAEW